MRGLRRGLILLTLAALAAGMLAACGDDDDESGGETTAAETTTTTTTDAATEEPSGDEAATGTEVTVTADEYSFELSETPTEPGDVTFLLDNVGEEPHALIVARINEGFTLDEANELQGREGSVDILGQSGAGPGKEGAPINAELTAGNYGLVCPLATKDGESHYALGQKAEFTIE